MKTRSSLPLVLLLFSLTANAQSIYPKKDLAFAQVAAGGAYETVINVTNRGPDTYTGVLSLYRSGHDQAGQPWSPLVNGSQITNGATDVSINPGATVTYRITGTGGTEAGYAVFKANDRDLRNFLEGTLTYYITFTNALDSVGVQPSTEFYLTAIPFDDFSKLAMALANLNTSSVTAKLTVFSSTNAQVATLDQSLAAKEHMATYLRQLFPDLELAGGRLEIQCDLPIFGTILTDINDQLSSLPMLPGVKTYTIEADVGVISYSGELCLWLDGPFVQGYVRLLEIGGVPEQSPDTIPVTGTIVGGVLQAHTTGNPDPEQLLTYVIVNPFSLSQQTQQGLVTAWLAVTRGLLGTGPATMTAVN
jgi:hypothetical protein